MRNESGTEAGFRNVGRFFLWAIPLVLGLGAATWFGLWVSAHNFDKQKQAEKHEETQQERSAVYVGATIKPKSKLAVEIVPKTCMKIVRADVDTKKRGYPYKETDYFYSLILYAQNTCKGAEGSDYIAYHWQMLSPNGTVIKGGYENNATCGLPGPGETGECVIEIDPDERVDRFRVWAQDRP